MMISNRQGYVTQAQRHVSVFISHCEQDNEEAQYYESLFKAFGLSAFQYGHGLHFGNHITENLRKEITKCHFFVFIISDYSLKSEWVQRELGMAIAIQRSNEIRKPIIIPIFAKESSWRKANKRPTRFKTRNFDTGQKLDDFDLNVRCYDKHANPHSDSDDELLSRMRPIIHVTRVGDFFDESIFFETKVFSLYKKLFPPIERDDPEDIIRWTLHSDLGSERVFYLPEKITYKLDSRYFILTLFDQAIGLAFFTYDYSTNLMYGNYIGGSQMLARRGYR
ncbi:MAG: toll/interleukin-1 receptor domain-containing protein [Xanthobacteraceae bacterium]